MIPQNKVVLLFLFPELSHQEVSHTKKNAKKKKYATHQSDSWCLNWLSNLHTPLLVVGLIISSRPILAPLKK